MPYLADLGVSHLYLSPVLQAVPGSMHGYDVLDHTRVSDELGGEDGLGALAATARQHGLGLVVDVVPNHMALVAPESSNAPLWDVLAHGRDAAHAHWFDVDWDALDGRIGLPVLWEPLADVLAKGDLRLGEENGGQVLRYHDHVFPVADRHLGRRRRRRRGRGARPAALPAGRLARAATRCSTTAASSTSTALIAVRVEEPDVFDATHRVLARPQPPRHRRGLPHRPPRRAGRPRRATSTGCAPRCGPAPRSGSRRSSRATRPCPTWACDGTTGYDAAKVGLRRAGRPGHRARPAGRLDGHRRRPVPRARRRASPSARWSTDVLVPERRRLVRRAGEALPDADPDRLERGGRRAARGLRGLPRLRPARRRRSTTLARERLDARRRPGRRRPPRPEGRDRAASSASPSRPGDDGRPATSRSGCSRPGAR